MRLLGRRPGNKDKAKEYLQKAIGLAEADVRQREQGPDPKNPEGRRDLARFRNNLGGLVYWSEPARAASLFSQSRDELKALRTEAPTVPSYGYGLSRALSNLASLNVDRSNAGPLPLAERAQTPVRPRSAGVSEAVTAAPRTFRTATRRSRNTASNARRSSYQPGEGLYQNRTFLPRPVTEYVRKDLNSALELLDGLTRDFPGRPDYKLRAADVRVRLGLLRRSQAALDEIDAAAAKSDPAKKEGLDARAESLNSQALDELNKAVEEVREIPRRFPEYADSIDYRLTLAQSIRWLGVVRLHQRNSAPEVEAGRFRQGGSKAWSPTSRKPSRSAASVLP